MLKLKEQGHTLDSFLTNDPFDTSLNVINIEEVKELIENKDLIQLRAVDRSGHPGKLKRFIDIVQQIVDSNKLKDDIAEPNHFLPHPSQWPLPV
jgi:hypothetical protein